MQPQLILVIAAAVAAYSAWSYFHPLRPCRRCSGKGVNKFSTRRRMGKCAGCKGTGRVEARGARLLRKAVRSLTGKEKRP